MIGGIGHDVQKIKVRLEELQRDVRVFPPPSYLIDSRVHLGTELFPCRHLPPVANFYWFHRITTDASDLRRVWTGVKPSNEPVLHTRSGLFVFFW